jgi:hypothetical protein
MASAQRRKLPVWSTVKRAVVFPFANLGALIRIGLMPALLSFAVSYAGARALWPQNVQLTTPQDVTQLLGQLQIAALPGSIADGFVLVILAVGIHRLIIKDERPGWILVRFGRYELAYALSLLILAGGWLAILLPLSFGGFLPAYMPAPGGFAGPGAVLDDSAGLAFLAFVIALLILIPLTIWLSIRLTLAFPHAAVTGRLGLGVAWQAAKGNFWRLVGAFVLTLLVIFLIDVPALLLLSPLVDTLLGSTKLSATPFAFDEMGWDWLLLEAFMMPVHGITTAMMVAMMSYAYRELVEHSPVPGGADERLASRV